MSTTVRLLLDAVNRHGHHTDGSAFEVRGVRLMGLREDGMISRARLHMEPVEVAGAAIDGAIRELSEPSR